ncbi:NAD(P)-binding domain-containing protein [Halorubrum vacuolatum]|uniref:Prephenate dehydrogenase n=1 Tax=Halorubrum vacuolatum TaxID=63740 RepID=A0A238UXC0_HALVU|nr:NAD(P)-binding domain-containing protein [Halorubrum vacuolatum]SNR26387.1 prephenate dehydrogenase [Halorubrum vacuolatum]
MDTLVVGAGEMGRWVADTLAAEAGPADATVAFLDREPAVATDAAAGRPAARSVGADTAETFDVVCLAVPMSAVPAAVAAYADRATGAVVDVSGEMTDAVAALRQHAPDRERASFHPLFAPPRVPGNVAAVIDADGPHVAAIVDAIEAGGNDVFETTADEHDRAMETVQAGAHAAVLAWRLAGEEIRAEFHTPVSTALEAVADTVTEGSPAVYAEIQRVFDGADDVAEAARRIADADDETFADLYERARGEGEGRDRHA